MRSTLFIVLSLLCGAIAHAQKEKSEDALLTDPMKVNCVESNRSYTINISYRLKTSLTLVWDQRQFHVRCNVNNDGWITIVPFFTREDLEGSEHDVVYKKITDSISFQLIHPNDKCVSLYEAGQRITAFYKEKIYNGSTIPDNNIHMIYANIVPDDDQTMISVYFKRRKIMLPYANLPLDEYLKNDITKKIIGKKRRYCRVYYASTNKYRPAKTLWYRMKKDEIFPQLLPGDIIFIK